MDCLGDQFLLQCRTARFHNLPSANAASLKIWAGKLWARARFRAKVNAHHPLISLALAAFAVGWWPRSWYDTASLFQRGTSMKVFGYCRVATVRQANSGSPLEAQRQQINHYAMMTGWSVAEFFMEIGVSGSIPLADRLEGKRLWAALQPGDVIIAAKLDHAFRAAEVALDAIGQLKEKEITFHVVDLGGDITGNAIQNLVLIDRAEKERDYIPEP
jgi:Resolvase, N terminal domain